MFYPKSSERKLDDALFAAPTDEYRGAPFWAWNCKLEKDELLRQAEILGQMGFGGYHMHVRSGMATTYLSPEFMNLIHACVEKAKETGMRAYLYDEDRWPSGAAGGLVTKDPEYRMRILIFTQISPEQLKTAKATFRYSDAIESEFSPEAKLVGRFTVTLNEKGELSSYHRLEEGEAETGEMWYAYCQSPSPSTWYNNETYVNTLSKAAIDRFIDITYNAYLNSVGEEFGKSVPSIFTDEPQFARKSTLRFANSKESVTLPWSDDLPETFTATYGEDLVAHLPELYWEQEGGVPSPIRYHYHDHVCDRFTEAFAENCGNWCDAHGLMLTGHMYGEPTLGSQTIGIGEAMRAYHAFAIPGIDMLTDRHEYSTAKQAQSAVHQYGKEGMMSELYGVTGWDFDFRRHKTYGDWQAALGVTFRVPHLSWVSMQGEAKRDYPASINYQSPWWKEYSYIENHFARLATVLTRGKPVVKIGVIHPIESYWLHWGPSEQTAGVRAQLDQNFSNVINWLLFGGLDFDFVSESILPSQCEKGGAPLTVGEMTYDVIVVPGCETLRSTTIDRLKAFAAAGGKLIVMGDLPRYRDAIPADLTADFAMAKRISFAKEPLLDALAENRFIELRLDNGQLSEDLLYQLREDGDVKWLFIAKGKEPYNQDICRVEKVRLSVRGLYRAKLYDTLTGEIHEVASRQTNGCTLFDFTLQSHDSLLLRLSPFAGDVSLPAAEKRKAVACRIPFETAYTLDEPNALLLDFAEYALDDADFSPAEEILRADTAVRLALGYSAGGGKPCQPWCFPEVPPTHTVRLRYAFESRVAVNGTKLAAELPEGGTIVLDGKRIPAVADGYYVDKSIQTFPLPGIAAGVHTLELSIPYGERSALERCYLLGNFGVYLAGARGVITDLPEKLGFEDITRQYLPFYSGKLTYHIPFDAPESGTYRFRAVQYRACAVLVGVDGGKPRQISLAPYAAEFELEAGEHDFALDLYISRNNGFGPVHFTDRAQSYVSPHYWRTNGEEFSYEYRVAEEGLISAPTVERIK